MKKLTKLSLLAIIMLISVVLLTGCGKQTEDESVEGLKEYTSNVETVADYTTFSEMEGIEIKYPSNYKSIGQENMPVFMDPDVSGATINIVSAEFPSALTFEGYVEASIPGIESSMTIDGEVNVEYINLNGRKAARLDYVAESAGQKANLTQVIIKKDNKAYILTLCALQKDQELVSEKYENIIKSFK